MLVWDGVLIGVGAVTSVVWLAALAASLRAIRSVPRLDDLPLPERRWPTVSLVRPACNEAESLETSTRSALAGGYPDLQLVLVDDRSDDATPALVDRLAAEEERVVGVHVDELPDGWLGKLNAMQRGVEHADGEWLLFADADSHFAPGALRRAIAWADEREVDFVSVLPGVERADLFADAVFSVANALLPLATTPWRIEHDDDTVAATGAFLLTRRVAFERTPGFEWLRLEVSDDFGLCLMIKRFGGKAGFLVAPRSVRLTWYGDFGEMVRSMQKNFFGIAGRFSVPRCLVQAAATTILAVGPFLPLLAAGRVRWAFGVAGVGIGASLLDGVLVGRWTDRPMLSAVLPWFGLILTAGIVVRSAIVGARQGGIVWRGTLYRSDDLRDAQRVRL